MKIKCLKCGLESKKHETILECMKELSTIGCIFTLGRWDWCHCGAQNSFFKVKAEES